MGSDLIAGIERGIMRTFELTRLEVEALDVINHFFRDDYNLKLVCVNNLKYGNGLYTGYAKDSDEMLDGYDYLRNLTDGFDLEEAWKSEKISDMHYYLLLNIGQKFGVAF